MLQCQVLNSRLQLLTWAGRMCLSLSLQGALPSAQGQEAVTCVWLLSVPGPVLKLSGPFSSTNLHFLAQPTLFSTTSHNLKGCTKYILSTAQLTMILGKCSFLFLIFHTHMLPHSSFFPSLLSDI